MAVIRFKATHFHWIEVKDGKMIARDMCDCGCQNWTYEVNEGDTLVSSTNVMLIGHLKNIKVVSNRVRTHPKFLAILENVKWEAYEKERDTTKIVYEPSKS